MKKGSTPLKFFKKSYRTQLFINNEFVNSVSGKTFETINPATKEKLADVQAGNKEDVDKAVKAARKAFQSWRRSTPSTRSSLLNKLADLIEKNGEELALIDSLDNGKPKAIALAADVVYAVQCLRYYAGWPSKILGETIPVDGNFFVYTRKEPVGVCGQIIPWNFPLLMAAWKLGPALATGNTIVLKPSEKTPLSALKLAELIKEAGYPAGVVNVIPGLGAEAGAAIAGHMDIDKVAFTGSVATGKSVAVAAANSNLKKTTLELGGKSPIVIFEDSNIEDAVKLSQLGLFFNQGEVCTASSRVFVQEGVYEQFIQKAKIAAESIKVGDPLNPETFQGPQVDVLQYNKILDFIEKGKKEAKLVTGGEKLNDKGYYIKPTIFRDVEDDHVICKEEIFGPVMSVIKFKNMEDLVKRANKTVFGLALGIVTNDITKALTVANNVKAGTVWINTYHQYQSNVPFGGFKQSGNGRELGRESLDNYLETKSVYIAQAPFESDVDDLSE